jgi:phosphatidylserine/phosphatidylglycerophosphate/cardiolipin synthase-like enzyme
VKLIVQPDAGILPLVKAVRRASTSIDIVIFRFDRLELERALEAAVTRGVTVRALIAHTNRGGEKNLRKLEQRLLDAGVTVARTADDLPRYHGKMMVVDNVLYVFGFNYTRLDMEKSRSFGLVSRDARLVKEACALFEADRTRQPYSPGHDRLVVSPETSRELLTAFIRKARKELLIYDAQITDNLIQRVLQDRARQGVSVRVIGKVERFIDGIEVRKLADLRLHVRAMIRDGGAVFVGSQSLRKLELDGRREVGVIVHERRIAKRLRTIFEADWAAGVDARAPDKSVKGAKVKVKAKAKAKPKLTAAGAA